MLEKLQAVASRYEELCAKAEQPDFYADPARAAKLLKEKNELEPIVEAYHALCRARQDQQEAQELLAGETDPEMKELCQEQFQAALGNDLNTSLGLTVLYDVLKAPLSDASKRALIQDFDQVLSLGLLEAAELQAKPAGRELSPEETAEIEALIQKRAEARKAKDWATADAIRDELAARHVVMKDTPGGVEWHVEG